MKHPIESHHNLLWFLRQYFRYELKGLENLAPLVERGQSYLLVCNHSTNLIDPLLLLHSHYERFEILPHPIVYSEFLIRNPVFQPLLEQYGTISHKNFRKMKRVLKSKKPLLAFPGELQESVLRNFKEEPYTLKWKGKNGLLKFITRNEIPLVFVACIGADELVTQSNAVKMPSIMKKILGMAEDDYADALQLWTVAIHPPVKVTHIVTSPIYPKEYTGKALIHDKESLEESLGNLEKICQSRLDSQVASRKNLEDDIGRFIQKFIDDSRNLGI